MQLMTSLPGRRPLLALLTLAALGGAAMNPTQAQSAGMPVASKAQPAPVQLFIPGRITVGTPAQVLTVKLKGLETPGRQFSTSPCQVRFTVFDRQGRALLTSPNAQTACAEVLMGFSSKKGQWSSFKLNLSEIRKAGLAAGKYMILVHIRANLGDNPRATMPVLVSNTATLDLP